MSDLTSHIIVWAFGLSLWNQAYGWSQRSRWARVAQIGLAVTAMLLCAGSLLFGWRIKVPIGETASFALFLGSATFMVAGFVLSARRAAKDARAKHE